MMFQRRNRRPLRRFPENLSALARDRQAYRVGSDSVWMQGSPARVIGDGDALFGSGAAAALDLPGCVLRMRHMLSRALDLGIGVSAVAFGAGPGGTIAAVVLAEVDLGPAMIGRNSPP